MAQPRKDMPIRTKHAIEFGRKTVRLHIGRSREEFTVHEDLLCKQAPFFKVHFQPKRKPIEGVPEDEVTFCPKSCGKNFHYNCLQIWIHERPVKPKDFTCPHCRRPWPLKTNTALVHRFPSLDAVGFAIYNGWLYHHSISMEDHDVTGNPSLYNLLQAYFLGRDVRDFEFQGVVINKFLDTMKEFNIFPCAKTIKLAYEKSTWVPKIMLWSYLVSGGSQFDEDDADLPAAFWKDVAYALRKKKKMGNGEWDLEVAKDRFLYHWRK